eukprot:TRINITY_DN991_c0_g1_i1.p1 TRINITY_DN991_c0_g1~~TRINITY_DN991_c0_g1_i1.p1  ORF type:complete len:817 (-),score=198.64 TRINITY_DN991_c0_g1_i1:99-2375(-)
MAQIYSFEFSQPVSGLVLPYISFNTNSFVFSNDFIIETCGAGTFGSCSSPIKTPKTSNLQTPIWSFSGGGEPHGMLSIPIACTKFVVSTSNDENWHGFTLGAFGLSIDDPTTVLPPVAPTVYYPVWSTTPTTVNGLTKFTASLSLPGVNSPVTVTVSLPGGGAILTDNYYKSPSPLSPYISSAVANDPPSSSGLIQLINAQIVTIDFSIPVDSIVLHFVSFNGNTMVSTDDFTLISLGDRVLSDCGYFGCSSQPTKTVDPPILGGSAIYRFSAGGEPHGTLLFKGKFTRFVFASTNTENWYGFTIGTYGGITGGVPPRVPVYYTNWNNPTTTSITENGVKKYTGTITVPDGSSTQKVDVKLTLPNGYSFIQYGTIDTDYFKTNTPNIPYLGKLFLNAPPAYHLVAINAAQTVTVEFSTYVTGVVIDFISLNSNSIVLNDQFTIVAVGDGVTSACGYFGCTTRVTQTKSTSSSGVVTYTLSGDREPHGAILLPGSYKTLSFTVTNAENWNGFTFGILGANFDRYRTCVVSQLTVPAPMSGICPTPTSSCIRIVNSIPQTTQSSSTCQEFASGSGRLFIATQGQKVYLSSDAASSLTPVFDEVGVLTVTSPSKSVRITSYGSFEKDCGNQNYPIVNLPTTTQTGAVDITALFSGETGEFLISLSLINKYGPLSTTDAYICTGTNLKGATILGISAESVSMSDNARSLESRIEGYSFNTVVFVAVGCSVASVFLALVIFGGIAMTVNRNKNNSLKESFVSE